MKTTRGFKESDMLALCLKEVTNYGAENRVKQKWGGSQQIGTSKGWGTLLAPKTGSPNSYFHWSKVFKEMEVCVSMREKMSGAVL
jgi:hypothetical protein